MLMDSVYPAYSSQPSRVINHWRDSKYWFCAALLFRAFSYALASAELSGTNILQNPTNPIYLRTTGGRHGETTFSSAWFSQTKSDFAVLIADEFNLESVAWHLPGARATHPPGARATPAVPRTPQCLLLMNLI